MLDLCLIIASFGAICYCAALHNRMQRLNEKVSCADQNNKEAWRHLKNNVEEIEKERAALKSNLQSYYGRARERAETDIRAEYEEFKVQVIDELGGFEPGDQLTTLQKREQRERGKKV